MIRLEAAIEVEAPPAVVWDVIGDPRRLVDWDPGVKRVDLTGPLAVGSRFTITAEFLGRDRTSSARITVFEPGHRIGWQIDPGSRRWWADSFIRATYAVEFAASGRSRLTRQLEAIGRGLLGRLAEPLVARAARRERFAEVRNVKRAAESKSKLETKFTNAD
jgi:carbon monoxide dehydrogenase subunit G